MKYLSLLVEKLCLNETIFFILLIFIPSFFFFFYFICKTYIFIFIIYFFLQKFLFVISVHELNSVLVHNLKENSIIFIQILFSIPKKAAPF